MIFDKIKAFALYIRLLMASPKLVANLINNWESSISNPTLFYINAFRFYYFFLPNIIVEHKNYFSMKSRGFGEKAMHSLWYILFNKYCIQNFLEIGVYRGQIISLMTLIAKISKSEIAVYGISPFNNTGDSVSKYVDIDYIQDISDHFDHFKLKKPNLTKAFSTDQAATDIISSNSWDCIYIDGSHEYSIVKTDWENCSRQVKIGGIIVLDDSALYTDYKPPSFAFKGHPGPSKLANEIDNKNFKEVLRVGHNRVFERLN